MNHQSFNEHTNITFHNFICPSGQDLQIKELLGNLSDTPRCIPSKFLYDKTGSVLFEKITLLPEYYLTHLETGLIETFGRSNKSLLYNCEIVDLGSGSEKKVSVLLKSTDRFDSIIYTPLDVSISALENAASYMVTNYPGIHVNCIAADFLSQLEVIPENDKNRIYCFFGSTIGNLSPEQRLAFLRNIRKLMSSDDLFLLGVDLIKEIPVMEQAYNDRLNVTARFNRNVLNAINSLIQTNFNPHSFEHIAFFNETRSRIEMHLKASCNMTITSPYLSCPLMVHNEEMIHTENSHKFTITQISDEVESIGLHVRMVNTDRRKHYMLMQLSLTR